MYSLRYLLPGIYLALAEQRQYLGRNGAFSVAVHTVGIDVRGQQYVVEGNFGQTEVLSPPLGHQLKFSGIVPVINGAIVFSLIPQESLDAVRDNGTEQPVVHVARTNSLYHTIVRFQYVGI